MNELIQSIMDTINKKGVQSNCKKILKKCNMKSVKDVGLVTELAIWLYIYGYNQEAISVCDLFKNEQFNGNYTLWSSIDSTYCLKARILREQGCLDEYKSIIEFVNQYRNPELYENLVDWFMVTIDNNIQSHLKDHSQSGVKRWRLIKFEKAISYKEAGNFPIEDDVLEKIIIELKIILSQEK